MRQKTALMIKKVHDLLKENEYLTTDELCKKCHLKRWSIYQIIRYLRLESIGVIPTRKGYILSEFAKKNDDVHFMRRCFGRRTSDLIALSAAEPDITKRWKGIEDKNNITQVFKYLAIHPSNTNQAQKGIKYLLESIN